MAESQLPTFQQHLRQEKFIRKQLLLIISLNSYSTKRNHALCQKKDQEHRLVGPNVEYL